MITVYIYPSPLVSFSSVILQQSAFRNQLPTFHKLELRWEPWAKLWQVAPSMNAQNLTTFWCSVAKIQELAEEADLSDHKGSQTISKEFVKNLKSIEIIRNHPVVLCQSNLCHEVDDMIPVLLDAIEEKAWLIYSDLTFDLTFDLTSQVVQADELRPKFRSCKMKLQSESVESYIPIIPAISCFTSTAIAQQDQAFPSGKSIICQTFSAQHFNVFLCESWVHMSNDQSWPKLSQLAAFIWAAGMSIAQKAAVSSLELHDLKLSIIGRASTCIDKGLKMMKVHCQSGWLVTSQRQYLRKTQKNARQNWIKIRLFPHTHTHCPGCTLYRKSCTDIDTS